MPIARKLAASALAGAAAAALTLFGSAAQSSAATGWAVQTVPIPQTSDGTFVGVACVPSTPCLAVGRYIDPVGIDSALVTRWNGAGWTKQATPPPAGATGSDAAAASCPTSTFCVAVGEYRNGAASRGLVEMWNGTTWALRSLPVPTGTTTARLDGVSCRSATQCVAVGSYWAGSNPLPYLVHWDGTSWTRKDVTLPDGAVQSRLAGVSCGHASSCVAVGWYADAGGRHSIALNWDGATWMWFEVPDPFNDLAELTSVSCTSIGFCMASGWHKVGDGSSGMTVRWNGDIWTSMTEQSPSGATTGKLRAISCASSTSCVAVGSYYDETGGPYTFSARLADGNWGLVTTALTTDTALTGISCGDTCVAVGEVLQPNGTRKPVARTFDGATWTARAASVPTGATATDLTAVSCYSALACTAVGTYWLDASGKRPIVLSWANGAWTGRSAPVPAGTIDGSFAGVSCTAATWCVAVGQTIPNGMARPLVESWNGTAWTIRTLPVLPASGWLTGVSCVSTTRCVAVGAWAPSGNTSALRSLIATWNGVSWSLRSGPHPTGASSARLAGVSCVASNACTAVGSQQVGTVGKPLAMNWKGTTWTLRTVPAVAGATVTGLDGVSCVATTSCLAVGSYESGGSQRPYAVKWTGTAWGARTPAAPAGAHHSSLASVSCISTTLCLAAGHYAGTSGNPLILAWNGTTWSSQASPTPSAAPDSALVGVSCKPTVACMAVGSMQRGVPVPLVERRT